MRSLMIPSQRVLWLRSTSVTNSAANSLSSSLFPRVDRAFLSSKITYFDRCSSSSRNSVKKLTEINDSQVGNSLPEWIENEKDYDCRTIRSCNGVKLKILLEDFSDSVKSRWPILDENKNSTLLSLQSITMPSLNYLKFMTLCGFFALLGSQQAIAGTNIASQIQSSSFFGDPGDISTGFASAFLLIFFSELGDKTFFIAALLAARNSAAVVFLGTFGALGAMTIISVVIGRTFHYVDDILPFRFGGADLPIDDIAAAFLLIYFGVSTLLDASSDGGKADEEQKEAELAVSEFSGNGAGILSAASTIISTFALVFLAEWGDKSFFSTIALAAASSPLGVVGGALAGHGVATLLAVLGGSLLGNFLSEKAVAYIGGTLFLIFAAVTLIEIVN